MTIIDRAVWPREGHYRFFEPMSNPIFALTFPVDVTNLRAHVKQRGLSFYTAMVFLVTKSLEDVEAFRLRDRKGTIVRHDRLVPSFTDLKPDSDLFHIVTLEAGEDLQDFCLRAKALSSTATGLFVSGPGEWDHDQEVFFTCLPWFPVTGALNERDNDPCDAIPRIAWGKWEEKDGRTVLSVSMEANHRLVDGVHVGKFYQALERRIAAL